MGYAGDNRQPSSVSRSIVLRNRDTSKSDEAKTVCQLSAPRGCLQIAVGCLASFAQAKINSLISSEKLGITELHDDMFNWIEILNEMSHCCADEEDIWF